jgi:Regulator of ribonuclease activity B
MNTEPLFPADENGQVLRRVFQNGDDLAKPRMVDFYFAFKTRPASLSFAQLIDYQDLTVCVSYYTEQDMWQVRVQRYMVPTHNNITTLELRLTGRAEAFGGEADG